MVKQISIFAMSQMTVGTCSDFHINMNTLIETATPVALHIEEFMPEYTGITNTLASVVNRQRAMVSTEELKAADLVRDNAAGVIYNVVRVHLTSTVAAKKAAAKLLSPQLSAYKGIGHHEYTKQTSEVRGMLAVLDAEENAEAIETLNLKDEIESLRTANEVFIQAFDKRKSEYGGISELSDMKSEDLMNKANELYLNIAQRVNAYAIVEPTDAITTFVRDADHLVRTYAKIVESGTGEAKPEDAPEPTTP